MKLAIKRLADASDISPTFSWAAIVLAALLLGACGGGSGGETTSNTSPPAAATCDPNDPSTTDECGSVLIGFTDADGDFRNYTVNVSSLSLETANGRTVETLPRSTRINFTEYVDLTELVTRATIPPGTYVAGTISLDYTDAEVFVEVDEAPKQAVVTDMGGSPLTQTTLKIMLSERDQLVVTRGRPAFLQLDFDLAASHRVDIVPTPATAASEQFIVAEIDPVDEKNIRVRGPLVEVDETAMTYTLALRPFHDRDGDFGQATVYVADDTEFEVDEVMYVGSEGLRALGAAGEGTPTVAAGTLNVAEREFTADIVLAGSSVPGIDRDAVVGNVIARNDNFLTIRGATIIPSDRRAHFHNDVVVEVGPNTRVFKDGDRTEDLDIRAISIGQRVTVRGNQPDLTTDANAPQILFDATQGAVRMHITHLAGVVKTVLPGQTDIVLRAIDRRPVRIFDFAGTGPAEIDDADPQNYEVATGDLSLAAFAEGKPIVAYGFPTPFGSAPPDFNGRTIIDYTDVRSALGVGWGQNGTTEPFLRMDGDGLLLHNGNDAIDQRHFIKQGTELIDLTTLDSDTLIVPRETGRKLFSIKSRDSLRLYSDFAEFVDALTMSLDGMTAARSMFAYGKYDADANVFTAYKVGVVLLGPDPS
jgi:hypothetical protein